MSTLAFFALAVLIDVVLASEYDYGYGEYGAGHHGHDHDSKYGAGYTKGFDTGGYGDYGSHKYGGWGSYAKGKEHGSYYGNFESVYQRLNENIRIFQDLSMTTTTVKGTTARNTTKAGSNITTAIMTMDIMDMITTMIITVMDTITITTLMITITTTIITPMDTITTTTSVTMAITTVTTTTEVPSKTRSFLVRKRYCSEFCENKHSNLQLEEVFLAKLEKHVLHLLQQDLKSLEKWLLSFHKNFSSPR
ncbi:hypothetical protein V3C99_009879 [Haemonchus contortus]